MLMYAPCCRQGCQICARHRQLSAPLSHPHSPIPPSPSHLPPTSHSHFSHPSSSRRRRNLTRAPFGYRPLSVSMPASDLLSSEGHFCRSSVAAYHHYMVCKDVHLCMPCGQANVVMIFYLGKFLQDRCLVGKYTETLRSGPCSLTGNQLNCTVTMNFSAHEWCLSSCHHRVLLLRANSF